MFSRTDIPRKESEEIGEHILTKAVKAGRRTYFFDVRATRGNDYYLTITESRKTTVADGSVVFDRHKIFLYKEDFARFDRTLREVLDFIAACQRADEASASRKRKFPFRNEKNVVFHNTTFFLCGGSERPVRRDMNTLIRDFTSESGFRLSGGIARRCRRPARRTPFGRDSRRFAVVGEGWSGRRAS